MTRGTDPTGRHAVLYPAIASAAARVGADTVGLIDVGCAAGFNLHVDRVQITYTGGPSVGDPSSPVQVSAAIMHERPVPARAMPSVVARIGLDPDPLDVTDPDDAARLRAGVQPDRAAFLESEITLAATVPRTLLAGGVDLLPAALGQVPAGVLPVVTTTWALSRLDKERRLRFLQALDAAATHRTVAWVSVEGVGVAPAVPTFGDRPASGHSIIGITLADHRTLRSEGVGRCWSRGRMLEWLADA